jgi:branched-chain amino acid transport system substrate-binding protein
MLWAAALVAGILASGAARAAEPITIGFGMALTGGLAAIGKSALLAMQIWEADVNAKGGLLGRPVKLIFYDDQSNPSTIPALYTKLIDIDKVDITVSGYATNMVAPAMPIMIQRNRLFLGLFALAVNAQYHYPKYFSMLPTGPDPAHAFSEPFFELAMKGDPKPKTVAIVAADAEYPHTASAGARDIVKKYGLQTVYDRTYPPQTTDYTPIVRAIQAANPEIVFVASYPPDSVGMVRAATELGLKTQLFGGAMVGGQYASLITQLSDKLNRVVNYHFFVPSPKLSFPGIEQFLQKYQAQAKDAGVDPLGFYQPPFAYAAMQVLQQAVTATGSLNDDVLAQYIHKTAFNTIVGEIKFNELGEWATPRVLMVQFQNVQGTGLDQYLTGHKQVIVGPAEYKDGDLEQPFSK